MAKSKAAAADTAEKALTLRDVAADLRAWADTIEGLEGDEQDAALKEFASVVTRGAEKAERFVMALNRFEHEAAFAQLEIDKWSARKNLLESKVEDLRAYAFEAMTAENVPRIDGSAGSTLALVPIKSKVIITDEIAIPRRFKKVSVTMRAGDWETLCMDAYPELAPEQRDSQIASLVLKSDITLDKAALSKAIMDGEEIAGADVDCSGMTLRITQPTLSPAAAKSLQIGAAADA